MQLESFAKESTVQKYERFRLSNPTLLRKPSDIPDNYIAYNPSGIHTVESSLGEFQDIMYLRVEPKEQHLGKAYIIPYEVNLADQSEPLRRYEKAPIICGEDPALTRIKRKLGNGAIENIWLLSCVDVQPFADNPDCVKSLRTKFFAGKNLDNLEQIAVGPEWMKDIRIAPILGSETGIHIYGRPQPMEYSGNISYTTASGIDRLNENIIRNAPFIDDNLFRIGSEEWGGANDVAAIDRYTNLVLAHRAKRIGADLSGRHYEIVLLEHDLARKRIKNLGVLATADSFGKKRTAKADHLNDVAFPGGFHNSRAGGILTSGVGDGEIAVANLEECA